MSFLLYDLAELYRQTFGTRPVITDNRRAQTDGVPFNLEGQQDDTTYSRSGQPLTDTFMGKEVWLPVTFFDLPQDIFSFNQILLPYTVVKISVKKTIIKTALPNRKGTVKEVYGVDDYAISIKGFAIDENRVFPERELEVLKYLAESKQAVGLDCPLTNIFLINPTLSAEAGSMQRVVVESLDLPEVEGGRKHIRPFSLKLESDSIFELEVE
jgi:hypothetical protein